MINWDQITPPMPSGIHGVLAFPEHPHGWVEVCLYYQDGTRSNVARVDVHDLKKTVVRSTVAGRLCGTRDPSEFDQMTFLCIDDTRWFEANLGLRRDGSLWRRGGVG